MSSAGRRALFAVLTSAALVAVFGSAGTALAACNPANMDCGGPGGDGPHTYSNTLSVSKTIGTVTSSPAGLTDCGTGCKYTDSQTVQCEDFSCPDADPALWDTVTLTASGGPSGHSAAWSGCASTSGSQCTVTVDADKTVTLTWSDTALPTVSLTSPPHGGIARNSVSVSASASDNVGVSRVDYFIGDEVVRRATSSLAPSYFAAIDLTDFDHGDEVTVKARATDVNGNTGAMSSGRTITVDRQINLTVGAPLAFTNAAEVPVSIGTDPDADMACRIVGGAAPVQCDPPTWSGVNGTSPDGSYTYEVTATDAVGNTATETRSFVLDRTAPAITSFDGPTEGSIVGTDRVRFTFGTSDANLLSVQCKVGSAAAGPCTSATSHEVTGLTDGTVTFSLIVRDKAGNQTTRTRTFQVQRPVTNTGSTGGGSGTTQTQTPSTQGTSGSSSTAQAGPGAGHREELKVNPAKLKFKKQRRAGRTRLSGLQLTGVPKGARITAKCKGKAKKGCPRKAPKAIRKSGTVKLSALAKLKLRKGAVLTIVVSAPGYAPKTLTVRI
jgi:hypothetical protein